MRKYSVFIVTFGMIWALVLVAVAILTGTLSFLGVKITAPVVVADVVGSFVISLILILALGKKEKNNPIGSINTQLKKEMRENGMSDHFFELAEQGIALYNGTPHDFVYFKDFIMFGADGYIQRDHYDKALRYLNMIDMEQIKSKNTAFFDSGFSLISFFDVQMSYCVATKDIGRAERVVRDAEQFITGFRGKDDSVNLMIDDFYCMYCYLIQDYSGALQHAQSIMNNNCHTKGRLVVGQLNLALIYNKTGDTAQRDYYMNDALKIIEKSGNPVSKQSYEYCKKVMARGD